MDTLVVPHTDSTKPGDLSTVQREAMRFLRVGIALGRCDGVAFDRMSNEDRVSWCQESGLE